MPIVQLEHAIKDFGMWKAAFDRDPIDRAGLGVRHHRVLRPVADANYVVVELELDTHAQAEACVSALNELWRSRAAAPALAGAAQARIVDVVEDAAY